MINKTFGLMGCQSPAMYPSITLHIVLGIEIVHIQQLSLCISLVTITEICTQRLNYSSTSVDDINFLLFVLVTHNKSSRCNLNVNFTEKCYKPRPIIVESCPNE